MPKISAPTVAEHRANRRAALISAGEEVLREDGLAGVTPRRVCERAGLSRSSFYDYFSTRDDLLATIVVEAIGDWELEVEQALAGVPTGIPALRVFVDATLAMAADGRHDLADVLRDADLAPRQMADLMAVHDTLLRPLIRILDDLGVTDPTAVAVLVQGLLGAGVQLVTHGMDHRTVAEHIHQLVTRGLDH